MLGIRNEKPCVVGCEELANLLTHTSSELSHDSQVWFSSTQTRHFIAEFLSKDISRFSDGSDSGSVNLQSGGSALAKRKRDQKVDSKLEELYKKTCVCLNNLNSKRNYGVHLKHDISDYLDLI